MPLWGAIEAGGTKFVCGVGSGPEDFRSKEIPTSTPQPTIAAVVAALRELAPAGLRSVGVGSFGPVDINPASPAWGSITSTPKTAWRNYNIAGAVNRALAVPVHFNTDVNAAILGEARWGAARGIPNCLYLTVGTGIGGGALSSGRLLQGISHPEMGHIHVPHDSLRDPFHGVCPYHRDCLEGLASGPAMEARWGVSPVKLPADHPAWPLGIANFACTLGPQRVLIGGGVMRQSVLLEMIRSEVARLLGGYIALPEILPPLLGQRAGVLGALALATG